MISGGLICDYFINSNQYENFIKIVSKEPNISNQPKINIESLITVSSSDFNSIDDDRIKEKIEMIIQNAINKSKEKFNGKII